MTLDMYLFYNCIYSLLHVFWILIYVPVLSMCEIFILPICDWITGWALAEEIIWLKQIVPL